MKKVLIITYYWPPAGGPGVQRVLKFAKYLPQFGWEPIIFTVQNGEYYAIDENLLNEIPEGIKVYKTKIFEPYNLYRKIVGKKQDKSVPVYILNPNTNDTLLQKISKWIRVNLFIPDPRIFWYPIAASVGKKIIKKEDIELIFTSSPPHTVQLIGKHLSKKTRIPWVADFRDPWTQAFWFSEIRRSRYSANKNTEMEKSVLVSANALTFISNSLFPKDNLKNKYYIIPNGYDPDDFTNMERTKNNKFTITFVGNLSKSQNLDSLINALERIDSSFLNSITLKIFGNIHEELHERINQSEIKKILEIDSYKKHDQFVKNIVISDLLLLVIPNVKHNKGIVTGKIFEYLATDNFILGIGPKDGDAAKILNDTNHGQMFDYNESLSNIIIDRFQKWRKNEDSLSLNLNEIDKYSRLNLTKDLVTVFESVVKK